MHKKIRLGSRDAAMVPAGFSQILGNFAWQAFAAAEPSEVEWSDVSLVQGAIEAFQKQSRWKANEETADWTFARATMIKSMRSPTGHRKIWQGDCKALCLKLMQKLRAAGIEYGAMRLVLAKVDGPVPGHLFLAVETQPKTILYDCRKLGTFVWGSKWLKDIEWLAATDRGQWKEIET